MKHLLRLCLSTALLAVAAFTTSAAEPLRALLLTGGCCHDYAAQKTLLSEGISARANVTWTIVHEAEAGEKDHELSVYAKPDWTKGYDVIVHDECFGGITNVDFVNKIAAAHASSGVPAVVLHCSIHSYRDSATDDWRLLLGVSSMRHQVRRPFAVTNVAPEHPIMKDFPALWQNQSDELYEIVKVWPKCTPLARSITPGKPTDQHPSIWINTTGKARVFGTTLGHGNETIQTKEYLDVVTRGLLWACDKLEKDGSPKKGYGPAEKKK